MKKFLIAFVAVSMALASCSKNPEKNLPRKDGKWEFTGIVKIVDTDPLSPFSLFELPISGTFTFDKNGTYSSMVTVLGTPESSNGIWSATKTSVTTSDFLDEAVKWEVSDAKSKSQTWEYKEVDGSSTTTYILNFER